MFGMDNMIADLMSSKLEETLAVIRQVMEQFQDAVRFFIFMFKLTLFLIEFNDIRLRLHSRVFIFVRNRKISTRIS